MKKFALFLFFTGLNVYSFAQLNVDLIAHIPYNEDLNDVWGWTAPDGTEYGIVGLRGGVSIVSLADEDNVSEVAYIPGPQSTWRDIKTWGDYAYVTNEEDDGLLIIDMSALPGSPSYTYWSPDLLGTGSLRTCHNLYIDEFGYCYLAGCNLNSGGVIILDVFTTPGQPVLVGKGPNIYSHDVYARNNNMYSSEIFGGNLGIYDVSDKTDVTLLASQPTPAQFTHNAWLSDNGNVVFTTDERANAPIGAYDISDLGNIVKLDEFRPLATLGTNVIPHNVHVWQDWLIISYYTDGGIVVDASRPTNLIEVGNFDTFFGSQAGFAGAWGAYPFFPSQTVLVSSIGDGLFVLEPHYVRACWLEGTVTNSANGNAINGVKITIQSDQANQDFTDPLGKYETGQALAGTFNVRFFKQGYAPKVVEANLVNGQLTILDVALDPLDQHTLAGLTIRNGDGEPLEGVTIQLTGEQGPFQATSLPNGQFFLPGIYESEYEIRAGLWGYLHKVVPGIQISDNTALTIALDQGYQDDFYFDLGWESTRQEQTPQWTGEWELGEPIGTFRADGSLVHPELDITGDLGDRCYTTGNGGGSNSAYDVDRGVFTLTSPVMDLTIYDDPEISYYLWFHNGGGNSAPDDSVTVKLYNGQDSAIVEVLKTSGSVWRPQTRIRVKDFLEVTDEMRIAFVTGDLDPTGHLVEAGVDGFKAYEFGVVATEEPVDEGAFKIYPNPFHQTSRVEFDLGNGNASGLVRVFNAAGIVMETWTLNGAKGALEVGSGLPPGVYFLQLLSEGRPVETRKMVKIGS